MADIEITIDGGTSKRLLTAGKYCDKNILVTATGGGGEPEPPDDGKTRLYITVPANAMPDRPPPRNQVPLYIQQTVANGVTIDWGDGTEPETLPGTGAVNTTHTYEQAGDYVISLEPAEGCELGFGTDSSGKGVLGNVSNNGKVYLNMLRKLYIRKNVASLGRFAFNSFYSLEFVSMSDGIKNIGYATFQNCYYLRSISISYGTTFIDDYFLTYCYCLTSISIPDSVVSIGEGAISYCYALASISIPGSVVSIGNKAFASCYGMKEYHFLSVTPPALEGTDVFNSISSDCIIYVPKGSAEAYKTATNWTTYSQYIQEEPGE